MPSADDRHVSATRIAAGRIAARSQLADIRAISFNAELLNGNVDPPYQVTVSIEPGYETREVEDEGWLLLYSFTYKVAVGREDDVAVQLECTYNAAFVANMAESPSDDELEAFGDTTVALALYPYLREFVHGAVARFNLSALVMPMYREPLKERSADATPNEEDSQAKREGTRKTGKSASSSKRRKPSAAAKAGQRKKRV